MVRLPSVLQAAVIVPQEFVQLAQPAMPLILTQLHAIFVALDALTVLLATPILALHAMMDSFCQDQVVLNATPPV